MKFKLDLGIFPYDVAFCVEEDWKECPKYAKRLKIWNGEGQFRQPDGDGCCYTLEGSASIIWLEKTPKRASGIALLAHECVHAVENAARFLGFGPHEDAEEFRAYATQYLIEEALKKLW